MSIKITENGNVHYVNENDVSRDLFPNEKTDFSSDINDITNEINNIKNAVTALNNRVSELDNQVLIFAVESETKTLTEQQYINYTIPYTKPDGYNVIGAVVYKTPNAAHVTGFVEAITSTAITVGAHNTDSSPWSGYFKLLVFCRKV